MQAFVRYLSCFLIIQACVCGGVLVLYKRYAAFTLNKTGYLAASVDKHHLLVQQPSPRIVFVGGSNLAFGLDSLAIERSLGYHPINMGLHLALGLDFMLAEIEAFLKPDDVVLISLEYEHFVDLYTEDGGTLFTEIQSDPHSIHFLTFRHLALFCDQGLIIYCIFLEMNFQNERTVRQEEKYWEEDVQLYEYLLPVALRLVGTRSCFAMV